MTTCWNYPLHWTPVQDAKGTATTPIKYGHATETVVGSSLSPPHWATSPKDDSAPTWRASFPYYSVISLKHRRRSPPDTTRWTSFLVGPAHPVSKAWSGLSVHQQDPSGIHFTIIVQNVISFSIKLVLNYQEESFSGSVNFSPPLVQRKFSNADSVTAYAVASFTRVIPIGVNSAYGVLQSLIPLDMKDINTLSFLILNLGANARLVVIRVIMAHSNVKIAIPLLWILHALHYRKQLGISVMNTCYSLLFIIRTMMQSNITVIYVKKKEIQTFGFIIVPCVINLLIQNVPSEDIHLLGRRLGPLSGVTLIIVFSRHTQEVMIMLSLLSKHFMTLVLSVMGLAKM
ncbi:hypothetical protein PTKIN_Ptkin16aG0097300 [Pterospermum kingtungense]